MSASVTDLLCTRCGLCCNGSLFADVELASQREANAAEAMGLEVEDGDDAASAALLLQPCRALKNRRCAIYPHRPKCCRTFECLLLKQVIAGVIPIAQAHETVAETQRLIAARSRAPELESIIRKSFLGY